MTPARAAYLEFLQTCRGTSEYREFARAWAEWKSDATDEAARRLTECVHRLFVLEARHHEQRSNRP